MKLWHLIESGLERPPYRRSLRRMKGAGLTCMAFLFLCACVLVSGCDENCTTEPAVSGPVPDDVRGLWQWLDGPRACTAIESDSSGTLCVGIAMRDPDCPCCPGERHWEFRWDPGRGLFTGRHLWGGCGYDTTYWGDAGSLEVTQLGRDNLRVVYTDSHYTDGWRLVRVAACAEAETATLPFLSYPSQPSDPGNGRHIARRYPATFQI